MTSSAVERQAAYLESLRHHMNNMLKRDDSSGQPVADQSSSGAPSPAATVAQSSASASRRPSTLETIKSKVASACDACKRRKVKCTGSQPCDRCKNSGISCTYGSATGRYVTCNNRDLASTVDYTRHLEEKVQELQHMLLQTQASRGDGTSFSRALSRGSLLFRRSFANLGPSAIHPQTIRTSSDSVRDQLIETMIRDEDGFVFAKDAHDSNEYHGSFAGLSMLRTVRDLCTKVAGAPIPQDDLSGRALAEAFDSNALDLPHCNRMAQFALLPSRERVRQTVTIALDTALNLRECIDRTQLDRQIQQLYDRDPEDYTQEDRRALALLYALMAIGRRFQPESDDGSSTPGTNMIVIKGVSYFRAARSIVDITDNHDLNTIRALIVMANFLAASSMISKAYSYICAAAAASLRMGLHVSSFSQRHLFTNAELTERRQVFAVLYLMDTFFATTLGMPNILRDSDPRQLVPCREEDLEDEGKGFVEQNPLLPISETILAAKLLRIQARILQAYFPMESLPAAEAARYLRYEDVAQRETELQAWHETLPEPSPPTVDHRVLRSQLLLRFIFSSTQMTLYRPFIHHLIRPRDDAGFDFQGYAFGSACIRAAMQAVWLVDTMDRHGYLHEAQWFAIVTLAFASSSLNLFVLGTKEGPTVEESRSAALRARELLFKLGKKNVSARRCYESLSRLPAIDVTATSSSSASAMVSPAAPTASVAKDSSGVMSPRTQFMRGIGVLEPEFMDITTAQAMAGQTARSSEESGESEENSGSSGEMSTS